jgi:transcription antitermination factor NusG
MWQRQRIHVPLRLVRVGRDIAQVPADAITALQELIGEDGYIQLSSATYKDVAVGAEVEITEGALATWRAIVQEIRGVGAEQRIRVLLDGVERSAIGGRPVTVPRSFVRPI